MSTHFSQEIRQLPFVRLLLYFVLGIIFQFSTTLEFPVWYTLPIFALLLLFSKKVFKNFNSEYISGILVFSFLFVSGIASVQIATVQEGTFPTDETTFTAIVDSPLEEKANSRKTLIKLVSSKKDSVFKTESAKILVYLAKDNNSASLKYGDKIIFSSRISNLSNPGNPNEFDFAGYLKRKGITGQTYLQTGKWQVLGSGYGSLRYNFAYSLRDKLINIYKENDISGQNLAVLSALTLGDKSELSPETKQAYSSSGAMHVLAVSGLHVGIIYVIIGFLLKFLDRIYYKNIAYGKYLKAISIIAFLWFFALLSGLSPSVRRAALMFTFFVVADILKRPGSIYNSLASSAFVLLAWNPFLLLEIGFLMSYLAVFSIVFLQPKLYNLLYIKNKHLDKLWALTSVSIAAQAGTTPLSLYFFHQFPNWFMLTNLAVIPLATIIVYMSAALFATSTIPIVGKWVAQALDGVVYLLNKSVNIVETLPFSATYDITFRSEHLIISYVGMITLLLFLILQKANYLKVTIGLFCVLGFFIIANKVSMKFSPQMIVFNSQKVGLYNFISGNENILIGDTAVLNPDSRTLDFSAKGFWLNEGLPEFKFRESKLLKSKNSNFIQFEGKRIAVIKDKKEVEFTSQKPLKMDFVIISNNPYVSIEEIVDLYQPELIIFDSSNKKLRCERWREECLAINQEFFSVPGQGAFITEF